MRNMFKYVDIQNRGGNPRAHRSGREGHYLLRLKSPNGMPWVVRLIPKGGRYGSHRPTPTDLRSNLINKEDDPLVEFLDGRYHREGLLYGSVQRRMRLSALRARPPGEMVTFQTDTGIKEYLSAENMLEVLEFCDWAHADSKVIDLKNNAGIPFNIRVVGSQGEIYDARYIPTLGGCGMLLRRISFDFLKTLSGPLYIVNEERYPELVLSEENIQDILRRSGARCNDEGSWVWVWGPLEMKQVWEDGDRAPS